MGTATVEVRATNDGLAWSNALHFTFTLDGLADGMSVETCALSHPRPELVPSSSHIAVLIATHRATHLDSQYPDAAADLAAPAVCACVLRNLFAL